jgi:phospholipid/cholesterol/gamma-HCH transport system permease protein
MTDGVRAIGRYALSALVLLADVGVLIFGAVKSLFVVRTRGLRVVFEIALAQTRFTGAQGLPLVAFAAFAIGTLIQVESITFIPSAETVIELVAHVTVKDFVPILVALVVIGRSGTAISVELGTMKLNGELDALVSLGIPLEHVVVLPRLVGTVVSFVGLTIIAQATALIGGYWAATFVVRPPFTLTRLIESVATEDLSVSLVKAVILGATIGAVCMREGFKVTQSPREIPQAATRGVVRSMTLALLVNSFLSLYA